MHLEKLKYSKCPSCKKHGIRAFFKSGRSTYTLTCIHCFKKFKINIALNTFVNISIAILVSFLYFFVDKYVTSTPLWFWVVIAGILLFGFEYFAPLEEIESVSKHEKSQNDQLPSEEYNSLSIFGQKLNNALSNHYNQAHIIKYFLVASKNKHIDTFCLIDIGDRLNLASVVTYDGGETLDLILLIENLHIPCEHSVKSVVSDYQIELFISDKPLIVDNYQEIIECSHNKANYWIGIKSIHDFVNPK